MNTKYITNNTLEYYFYWTRDNLPTLAGWVGALLMVAFSFSLFVPLALAGLTLLTYQAQAQKMTNLVALNLISIFGFSLQFFS
jgi:uncharacterized protein YybS (DUF2232 family)